ASARTVPAERVAASTMTRLAPCAHLSISEGSELCPASAAVGPSGEAVTTRMGVSVLDAGGRNVLGEPDRLSLPPKKYGSDPRDVASTSSTRSPRAESALPSVATRLVVPTPPEREKTCSTGTSEAKVRAESTCGTGPPSRISLSTNQRALVGSSAPAGI